MNNQKLMESQAFDLVVGLVRAFPGLVDDSSEVNGPDLVDAICQGLVRKGALTGHLLDVVDGYGERNHYED